MLEWKTTNERTIEGLVIYTLKRPTYNMTIAQDLRMRIDTIDRTGTSPYRFAAGLTPGCGPCYGTPDQALELIKNPTAVAIETKMAIDEKNSIVYLDTLETEQPEKEHMVHMADTAQPTDNTDAYVTDTHMRLCDILKPRLELIQKGYRITAITGMAQSMKNVPALQDIWAEGISSDKFLNLMLHVIGINQLMTSKYWKILENTSAIWLITADYKEKTFNLHAKGIQYIPTPEKTLQTDIDFKTRRLVMQLTDILPGIPELYRTDGENLQECKSIDEAILYTSGVLEHPCREIRINPAWGTSRPRINVCYEQAENGCIKLTDPIKNTVWNARKIDDHVVEFHPAQPGKGMTLRHVLHGFGDMITHECPYRLLIKDDITTSGEFIQAAICFAGQALMSAQDGYYGNLASLPIDTDHAVCINYEKRTVTVRLARGTRLPSETT